MMDANDQQSCADRRPKSAEAPAIDSSAADEAVEQALTDARHRLDAWLQTVESALADQTQLDARRSELEERARRLEASQAELTRWRADLEADNARRRAELQERLQELPAAQAAAGHQQEAGLQQQKEHEASRPAGQAEIAVPEDAPGQTPPGGSVDQNEAAAPGAAAADTTVKPSDEAPPGGHLENQQTASQDHTTDKQRLSGRLGSCEASEPELPPAQVEPAPEGLAPAEQPEVVSASDNRAVTIDDSSNPPDEAPAEPASQAGKERGSAGGEVDSLDLDPETARKLRVLRRLSGAGKSDAELLAQIQARGPAEPAKEHGKKRWWRHK